MKRFFVLLSLLAAIHAFPRGVPHAQGPGLAGKIVGGSVAAPHEFPYQVSLQQESRHVCSASILDANYIITAAQCAELLYTMPFSVVAGENNVSVIEGPEQMRKAEQIESHEDFNPVTFENDIALMRLSSPLTLNQYVQPINLPSADYVPSGNAIITGWGLTREGPPETLLKASVPLITDEECSGYYESDRFFPDIMLCAGYVRGGADACREDTGGALEISNTLVGIISWGVGCGSPNYPSVYTDVTKYLDWIEEMKFIMDSQTEY